MIKTITPSPLELRLIIQWPASPSWVMNSSFIKIYKEDGTLVTSVTALSVHATQSGIVWAEVEMFADQDGNPIFTGLPVYDNNAVITKVFSAQIIQMLSITSAREAYTLGCQKKPLIEGPKKKEALCRRQKIA